MPKPKRAKKTASLKHENQYFAQGLQHIFGFDEAGRGAWAGPVAVGVVCLPSGNPKLSRLLTGVRDSKQTTHLQREQLIGKVKSVAITWGIGSATNLEIDKYGINPATFMAMERALGVALEKVAFDEPDALFLDSLLWPEMFRIPQVSMIDGDKHSLTIAAASILAKIWRDDVMRGFDEQYPQYEFAAHVGYGTAKHQAALKQHGVSPIHRTYYKPVQKVLDTSRDES
jgi:ribonuclease HII